MEEAPVSLNFKVSYKGINVQVTNRDLNEKIQPFFDRAKQAIDWALANGFQPEIQKSFGMKKEIKLVEGKKCPKCGSGIAEKNKKDGSGVYFKCEKGGWNPTTRQATGCDYVDWNNPIQPQPRDYGNEPRNEDYDGTF